MRRPLLAALFLGPAAAFFFASTGGTSVSPVAVPAQAIAAKAAPCDQTCDAAWLDSHVAMNQLQQVGSNASAKQKPEASVLNIIRMGGSDGAKALEAGRLVDSFAPHRADFLE